VAAFVCWLFDITGHQCLATASLLPKLHSIIARRSSECNKIHNPWMVCLRLTSNLDIIIFYTLVLNSKGPRHWKRKFGEWRSLTCRDNTHILETSLSRQLIVLVLTTKNKETKHYTLLKYKWQTQEPALANTKTKLQPPTKKQSQPYSYNPGVRMKAK